jgi:hypothetical protein
MRFSSIALLIDNGQDLRPVLSVCGQETARLGCVHRQSVSRAQSDHGRIAASEHLLHLRSVTGLRSDPLAAST